nr:putative capsid protein [Crucivirus sp.]
MSKVVRVPDDAIIEMVPARRAPARRAPARRAPAKRVVTKSRTVRNSRGKRVPRLREAGIISQSGSALGGALGSAFGPLGVGLGSFLGGKAGHLIEQITGFGDYAIEGNSIMGLSPPEMRNSSGDSYIVRHREFITDISPSTTFTNQSFRINPGISSSFPWLSQIAGSFDEYRMRGMIFEFKSMSSDSILSSGASTSLGSVVMATQYNSLQAPFADKKTMENYQFANSAKPSQSFMHPIECARSLTAVDQLFVRNSSNITNLVGDLRLYDAGNFQIATVGMQNTTGVIGELWVTYEIEFLKPRYRQFSLEDHYLLDGVTNAAPFGLTTGAHTVAGYGTNGIYNMNNIGGTINAAGTAYSFPHSISSGKFLIVYVVNGGATAVTLPTVTLVNCSNYYGWLDQSDYKVCNTGSVGAFFWNQIITVTGSGASFTWATAVLPTSIVDGDLYVVALSDTVL